MSESKVPAGQDKSRKVKIIKRDSNPIVIVDKEKRTIIVRYDSTSQLRQNFEENPSLTKNVGFYVGMASSTGGHSMPPGTTAEQAIACATDGIETSVPLIMAERKRAEKLAVQIQFPSWQPDVVGAFPCVPDFLAGSPESMRRLVNKVQDTRPVRIFVGMASSSIFSSNSLEKRGALISALALQLSKTRVVEVYAINSGCKSMPEGDYDWSVMVKLSRDCSARDMSFWLCHQASVRGLLYAAERFYSGPLSWPAGLSRMVYHSQEGIKKHAEIWGAKETDIIFPFPFSGDAMPPEMLLNPDLWMRNALKRVNAI